MFKKKGLLVIVGILVVAGLASVLFSQGQVPYMQSKNDAAFCKNCHEMNPDVFTWQVSSHAKVGCLKCHEDVKIRDFAYKHWRGFFETPIVAKTFVSNDVCAQCHTTNREITVTQGDIVPHQIHATKGVDCIDCHKSISHFNVSDRLIAAKVTNTNKFSMQDALKLRDTKSVEMATCLRCHNGAKATNKCSACHTDNPAQRNTTQQAQAEGENKG